MKQILALLAAGACAAVITGSAQAAPDVSVKRIECGTPQAPVPVNPRFSDTFAYGDLKLQFVYSCYLIKHGRPISAVGYRSRHDRRPTWRRR
jgi:N-acyl homoserine lactone hydrolase